MTRIIKRLPLLVPWDENRRRISIGVLGLTILSPLAACGQIGSGREVVLNAVLYSYLDRVITDIIFNGTDLGVANKLGGTGTMTGVRVPFGIQTLNWTLDGPEGMPGNGQKLSIKNRLEVSREQIVAGTRYIGLHLYPDDTAEATFSQFLPQRIRRGLRNVEGRSDRRLNVQIGREW